MTAPVQSPEQAGRVLRALYAGYGYQPFRVQKFERYELYSENRRFLTTEKVLTFTNTDGRLMAMKPDVTLSIVQNTQPEGLRKVFYHENVYREQRAGEGFREIPQTGLECIGALDGYAVGEVVMLAARSLAAIRENWVLDVSHLGVVMGVLEESDLNETSRAAVLAAVAAKNAPALRLLCPGPAAEALTGLTALYGPLAETLDQAEVLGLPARSRAALSELRALSEQIGLYDLPHVHLDFSVVNDVAYYDDIVFRGFVEGAPSAVLSGGRYDKLLQRMGKTGGALGFAVYLDRLEDARAPRAAYDGDLLVCYASEEDIPLAVRTAEAARSRGETVRVEAQPPKHLRYRRMLRAEKGAVTEC